MIVEITEELESGLTEAERQVIEYINQHEDQFLKLTITELAEKSLPLLRLYQGLSESVGITVSRSCAINFLQR